VRSPPPDGVDDPDSLARIGGDEFAIIAGCPREGVLLFGRANLRTGE
jgi:GGDEF domain-containing protein